MQLDLFDVNNCGSTIKKKRVRYKTPTYKKAYKNDIINNQVKNDISSWGRMNALYSVLANFFPFPLFTQAEYFDFGLIRVWKNQYIKEQYLHNKQIFNGQRFTVIEAEIIGTEDLSIEERLYLHELLLKRLENNDEEPTKGIDNMILRLKRGETLCQLRGMK